MLESSLTAKGQSTLPKDVRRALGLATGDRIRYVILEGEVRLLKVQPVSMLTGLLSRTGAASVCLEDMDDAIAQSVAESGQSRSPSTRACWSVD
ncbi:MAG: type II toxin-antitoxin system PrlF family antitoxin [Roseivivax sp.]|nr:type II toxin-antitoxin system PrlF family antitoxin [Roseivivax sp.]